MNILVVNSKYPPEYAGSALRAHNTYLRLKKKYAINVKVLCSSIEFNNSLNYDQDGISVFRIAKKNSFAILRKYRYLHTLGHLEHIGSKISNMISIINESIPTIIYLIKNYQWIDVIHVFGNVTATSTAIIFAKITKKPIIIELVNLVERPSFPEPKLISTLFGAGYPHHAIIVAISVALKDACVRVGMDHNKIWCRPNPINESQFNFNRCRAINGDDNHTVGKKQNITILNLAKFMPLKNQIFMLDVMRILPDNYKLVLVGPLTDSGPFVNRDYKYFMQITNGVEDNKLSERVDVIPGFIYNPAKLMETADVFVFPSTREALGTPVLEAIACGIPVVTNDIPGVFDQWVNPGINGYICKLDPELWAKRIIDATQISKESMQKASAQILSVASTRVIDAEYFRRFKNILN